MPTLTQIFHSAERSRIVVHLHRRNGLIPMKTGIYADEGNFFLPELGFWLRYGWAVERAEPSDAYITLTKAGGILAAVVGLICCFV